MSLAPTEAAGRAPVSETTTASFRNDVLVGSMQQPVLVDFWAPWCGPCKQLAPALERAVEAADGKVRLFKMNIDDHPDVAKQLGIQSIPAVMAFQRGQPVDGFVGALPEGQIIAFLERLVGPLGSDAEILAAAEQALADGDLEGAVGMSEAMVAQHPENARALSVYLRAMLALGETERAVAVMAALPDDVRADPALKQAVTALELASQAGAVGDLADLQRRLEANPNDHQARFDLALALGGKGDRKGAADALLDIFKRDRAWNEDGARKQLLQFFEVWGPMDEATKAARRKLSSILFS